LSLAAEEKARTDPHGAALTDSRRTWSWTELDETLNRVVNALNAVPFGPERRAAVFARNSGEVVLTYLSCLHAGVSAAPVSAQLTVDEVTYILEDSKADVLFTGPETLEVALQAAKRAKLSRVVAWRSPPQSGVIDWDAWIDEAPAKPPRTDMPAKTYLQYTSGTTGHPKAIDAVNATMPHASTVAEMFELLKVRSNFTLEGPMLVVGPLYHNAPLGSVRALATGVSIVVMDRFDAEEALKAIERHRITTSVMVPTHFQRLLALPEDVRRRYDVSSLKRVAHTGAACAVNVKAAMIEWWGPILMEAYGGTESGTTNMITSEEWLTHPGSVGKTMEQFELQVIGDDGQHLGPNEVGQLFFKDKTGRGIVYRNDPEKTRAAHREPAVFTLGEMGYYDDDGYVYITDRVSDMIVSGGVNIYPAEIERVLLTHPDVLDAVVIGVPNQEMGEEVKALVIAKDPTKSPTSQALIDFCRERMAGYKRPRTIDLVNDVGRNAIGKVNKRTLRAPYWPTERTIG
jgi:acyl-CoA synthetase (AMP-forming)/AMP-acid ligase II